MADQMASIGVAHIIDAVLMPPSVSSPGPKNVVQVAQSVTDLSSLVDALTKADLVGTLSAAGTFTVFAPTNSAFQALDADTLAALLEPSGKADLVDILKYHVLATQVLSTDLGDTQTVATLQGKDLTVTKVDGTVKVNDVATVTMADQMASNGVAHIIDAVLMPPSVSSPAPKNVVQVAQSVTDLSSLVDALTKAELVDDLSAAGTFTVFAPTNSAFQALDADTLAALLEPAGKA